MELKRRGHTVGLQRATLWLLAQHELGGTVEQDRGTAPGKRIHANLDSGSEPGRERTQRRSSQSREGWRGGCITRIDGPRWVGVCLSSRLKWESPAA